MYTSECQQIERDNRIWCRDTTNSEICRPPGDQCTRGVGEK